MTSILHLFKNAFFLFLSFTMLTAGLCSKEDAEDDEPEEPFLVIDTTKAYVIINVINPQNPGTVSSPSAASYQYAFIPHLYYGGHEPIELSQSGDTSRSFWLLPIIRAAKAPQLPDWQFCNTNTYDPNNGEWLLIRCNWFKSVLGSGLKVAYRYNLNVQQRRSNDTYGFAQYWQEDLTAGTYPQNINTVAARPASGNDPYSWIEYSKIENSKASGTFRAWFVCGSGGSQKITEVLGKFGNIKIE